ncbi:hypothetical protein KC622_01590 [Candidatus Dojkabacteria bacterium]|uniref:Uncharacterized protein n=1 Tax=Candidatus Dojkabacteria bacterium TaxID=2099670 RepID=A0A955KVD6_9BACT|nr:hypothetical protein [Candidatus Dojkabacteria bacterium]MCB9790940.1 hypothetical protein [Candidatus Nomurabacteria bacterium]
MKYLLTQVVAIIVSVTLLYYFSTLNQFLPLTPEKEINWYNLFSVLTLVFVLLEGVISFSLYLLQKFLTCGWREFPDKSFSLKWGLGLSIGIIFIIVLNIFHLFSLPWGVVILVIISLAMVFLR